MSKIILDLAGGTGSWSRPYKAGYDVYNITLPDYDLLKTSIHNTNMILRGTKSLGFFSEDIYGILFAPTCTMFSLARTRAKTPRDFREGMKLVIKGLEVIWSCRYANNSKLKFWCIENPTGYLRQFLGKPAMTFNPCDFGDNYTKKTDLWGYFNIPKKKPVKLTGKLPSITEITSSKQAAKRAITPSGFANAFYKANK